MKQILKTVNRNKKFYLPKNYATYKETPEKTNLLSQKGLQNYLRPFFDKTYSFCFKSVSAF